MFCQSAEEKFSSCLSRPHCIATSRFRPSRPQATDLVLELSNFFKEHVNFLDLNGCLRPVQAVLHIPGAGIIEVSLFVQQMRLNTFIASIMR
jgi:hypothetical protein